MNYNSMNNGFPPNYNNLPPYYTYPNNPSPNPNPSYPSAPPLPKIQEREEDEKPKTPFFKNISQMNRGKICTVHYSLNNQVIPFKGILEDIGDDYYLICDPKTSKRYLLRFTNIYYLEFDDEIKY